MTTRLILLNLTQLRFLGTSDTYGEYTPLVHPEYADGVCRVFVAFCADELRSRKCDTISFFRFSPDPGFMQELLRGLKNEGFRVSMTPFVIPRILMPLPATWEAYLSSLSTVEQKMLKRRTRALMSRDVRLEVVTGPLYGEKDFNDFVRLHTAAWIQEGLPGYYGGSARFERFHREVLAKLAVDSIARLYFFSKDGIRFTAVQAFFVNGQCCFYLSGMDRSHELAPQSPGKVLLSLVIKKAIEEGCSVFDFQGGKEEYKLRLGGRMTSFAKALVWTGGSASAKVVVLVTLQMLRYIFQTLLYEDVIRRMTRRFMGLFRRGE